MMIMMLLEPAFQILFYCIGLWMLPITFCNFKYLNDISEDLVQVIEAEVSSDKYNYIPTESLNIDQSKIILIFTTLFDKEEWPNLKSKEGNIFLKKHGCPRTNCHLKYNTDDSNLDGANLKDANVVIFHDRDMPHWYKLKELSDSLRPKGQIWVYFTGENPLHSHHDVAYLDDIFDWTMTYKSDSDIWLPYFRYFPKKFKSPKLTTTHVKQKTNLIAWISSNCGLMRERVVYELYKILPVHVGGHCSIFYPDKLDCESIKECDNKIKGFKFYLAFENSLCDDYITEKYWYRAILNGVVPILLGGRLHNSRFSVIPGSYINVFDFENISALAKYLKYLDSNDTAYNEYFKWKDKYVLWKPSCDWPFEPYWACQMCLRLNNGKEKRQRIKMSHYWNSKDNCDSNNRYLELFLENSAHDFADFESGRQVAVNPYNEIYKELDYEEATSLRQENVNHPSEYTPQDNFETEESGKAEMASLNVYVNEDYRGYNVLLFFSCAVIGFLIYMLKIRL